VRETGERSTIGVRFEFDFDRIQGLRRGKGKSEAQVHSPSTAVKEDGDGDGSICHQFSKKKGVSSTLLSMRNSSEKKEKVRSRALQAEPKGIRGKESTNDDGGEQRWTRKMHRFC